MGNGGEIYGLSDETGIFKSAEAAFILRPGSFLCSIRQIQGLFCRKVDTEQIGHTEGLITGNLWKEPSFELF